MRHWLATNFETNNSLLSQTPNSPNQPPTTTSPRKQLTQSDGLVRVCQGNTRHGTHPTPSEVYWPWYLQQPCVEIASGFLHKIGPHQETFNSISYVRLCLLTSPLQSVQITLTLLLRRRTCPLTLYYLIPNLKSILHILMLNKNFLEVANCT